MKLQKLLLKQQNENVSRSRRDASFHIKFEIAVPVTPQTIQKIFGYKCIY